MFTHSPIARVSIAKIIRAFVEEVYMLNVKI